MTTATVMDDKPLTMTEAWRVYDRLYDEDHVMFIAEPHLRRFVVRRGLELCSKW